MNGELKRKGRFCEKCGSDILYFMAKESFEPAYGCSLDLCSNLKCKYTIIHCPGNMMGDPSTRQPYPISDEDYNYITRHNNKTKEQLDILKNVNINDHSKNNSLYDALTSNLNDVLIEKLNNIDVLESENKMLKQENKNLKDKIKILTELNSRNKK